MQPTSDYPLDYTKGPSSTAKTADHQPDGATLQKAAEELLDQAREYGSKAQDALRNTKPFLEKSVKTADDHACRLGRSRVCAGRLVEEVRPPVSLIKLVCRVAEAAAAPDQAPGGAAWERRVQAAAAR